MRYRKQLENHFEKYSKESPEMKLTKMASIIHAEDKSIDLKYMKILKHLGTIKRENSGVATVVNDNSWVVKDSSYMFKAGGDTKIYSVEFIDDLFTHYSRKGYNYTRMKAQLKFGLTPKAWGQIARQFNLSKDCDILSPYTIKNTSKEELDGIIEGIINKVLVSGEMTTQKYQTALARKQRRDLEADVLDHTWRQDVITELLMELPKVKTIELNTNMKALGPKELVVVSGDYHSGGEFSGGKITEDWNMGVLKEKLNRMAESINESNAKYVDLVILADLVETISGLNHDDSWKGIGKGMFGANIIIKTYEIIVEELINKVVNLRRVCGCGGNHDRLQASNRNGDTGATDLIFYMLDQRLKDTPVEVVYDPVLVSIDCENFGVIGVHGDKGLHRRNIEFLISRFSENRNHYQFVMSAHLHSFFCKKDDDQVIGRRVTVPAIITGNKYSDLEVGRASKSGFVKLYSNRFNQPEMTVVNI